MGFSLVFVTDNACHMFSVAFSVSSEGFSYTELESCIQALFVNSKSERAIDNILDVVSVVAHSREVL